MQSWQRFSRWKHSLSGALFAGGIPFIIGSAIVEHGSWWYDFHMNMGVALWTLALSAIAYRYLWEERSDPTRPPD